MRVAFLPVRIVFRGNLFCRPNQRPTDPPTDRPYSLWLNGIYSCIAVWVTVPIAFNASHAYFRPSNSRHYSLLFG